VINVIRRHHDREKADKAGRAQRRIDETPRAVAGNGERDMPVTQSGH
jgi:hypothetical protein